MTLRDAATVVRQTVESLRDGGWLDQDDATHILATLPDDGAGIIGSMAKKRGYTREFPTTREKRVYFMLDKIPPALWRRVKAKAKREGVSLRSLILGWCQRWVDGEMP